MNRFRKAISAVMPVVILLSCVIGSFIYTGSATRSMPDNPLEQEAHASQMVMPSGEELAVREDVIEQAKNAEIKKADAKGSDESAVISDDSAVGGEEVVGETTVNGGGTAGGNVVSGGLESSADKNAEIYGDKQLPSSESTDKVYFTTTIKDGETVHSRGYSFEIEHKRKELTVRSVNVYVNGGKQVQFKGDVLLDEGENTIRVAVEYADDSGRIIPIYKDYTVNVDLGDIIIYSNLTDKETAERSISFNAVAQLDGENAKVTVKCGDIVLSGEGGQYTAELKSGENIITILAEIGEHSKSRSFKIVCTASDELSIYTDLSDKTVHSEIIDFTAYIENGSAGATFTVVVNGKTIAGDRNYNAALKSGSNVIRLKAVDVINGEAKTIDQSYVIKYVPETTEETAPKIKYINVSNAMTVRGTDFTLDIQAEDHSGARIYQNGISVQLNGTVYSYSWASEFVSYRLWLESGDNTLNVRITDNDGRYSDYSYTINCEAVEDGEQIGEIIISVDANVLGLGDLISPIKVPIYQGVNGAEVIAKLLEDNGFTYSNSGSLYESFYLRRIQKQGLAIASRVSIPQQLIDEINADGLEWKSQKYEDSLGEHDYCQGSGWQYSVNGSYIGYSLSDYYPKDGDVVRIRYTLAYGKDIGGYSSGNSGGQNYDKTW